MKKLFIICTVVSVFAACKSKTGGTTEVTGLDTTLLYKNNVYADTAAVQPVASTPVRTRSGITPVRTSSGSGRSQNSPVTSQSGNTATTGTTAEANKKAGWSSAAKGAVIGGVGGAVTGAVISKKKGKGAIIGGAVGAAGGYIIGRAKDKKEGRVQ